MKIVEAVRTCVACPSQWSAKTSEGQEIYLRYRFARGEIRDEATWDVITSFDYGEDPMDGEIDLETFCEKAGVTLQLDGRSRK